MPAVNVMAHVGQSYYKLVYDHSLFKKCDWSEFYRGANKAIPVNTPETWGKEGDIHTFLDSDHAGDKLCFLIYVNTTLVKWFSKKQSIVETFVFGAEFVTMGIDALRG